MNAIKKLNSLSGMKRLGVFFATPFLIVSLYICFSAIIVYTNDINHPRNNMPDINLFLEAERRSILPPDKLAFLNEARNKGLVNPLESNKKKDSNLEALYTNLIGKQKILKEFKEQLLISFFLFLVFLVILSFFFGLEWVAKGFKKS